MMMPMRFRPFIFLAVAAFALLLPAAQAGAQMRVVTYNCAQLGGDLGDFQAVLEALMVDDKPGFATAPWVVVFQEVPSFLDDDLLFQLNAAAPPGVTYVQATYTSSTLEDNSAGAIALYYRAEKLTEVPAAHVDIPTGANRNTDRWLLTLNDYPSPEVSFYVYGSHLKAENDPPDIAARNAGCQAIRNNANTLPAGARILYLGDFNFYFNTEPAYQTMIAPGNARAIDAFGNASWFGGGANAIKHTQSPCASGCFLVGGGLDDRFDFIFFTESLNDATGLGRILGSYRSLGNDGQHYNTDINASNNFYYPGDLARSNALADALHRGSDHLPVVLDFRLPAIAHAELPAIPTVIEGAAITHPLTVANLVDAAAPVAGDALEYIAFGTGGFSGGGSGSIEPMPDMDIIDLTLDTSEAGVIDCGVLVFSTGPDVQNAEIILSEEAVVLRHAMPSFASKAIVDEHFVSAQFEADTGVQTIDVPVYNVAFDDLQAPLDVDAVSASTGPFDFVDGLATGIGLAPAMLTFSFDTTGAAPGAHTDSFVIDVSDEDLPGEALSTLALDLEVIVKSDKRPPCTGDMVDSDTFAPPPDGVVDGADLAFLLGEWGDVSEGGSPADIVDSKTFQPPPDGIVDGADLAVLLGAWGACD